MKGFLPTVGRMMLGLALLASFVLNLNNSAQGGAIDLRNRITGVRLLEHGIDPFHYKWHEGEPAEYCDPFNNPNLTVSRTTSTPALLLLYLPLAALPYRLAQFLWLFGQWLLLLGTAGLWVRACPNSRRRWLVMLFTAGFTYTASWRLHAERGQAYVLFAFVFAWWLSGTLQAKKGRGFGPGWLAGFLAALRPPFLLLAPFLALRRRDQLAGAAAGLLLAIGLPMLGEADCWPRYFSAMQTNSVLNLTHFYPHYAQAYPPRIEGVPLDLLAHYAAIPFAEFSFPALWSWLGLAPLPSGVLLLLAAAPFAYWLWSSRDQNEAGRLPGLAAVFFLVDLFLPAYRNSYNDVLILNVVAAALVVSPRLPGAAWPCVIALPVGWAVYAFAPEQPWLINVPSALFTLGAILFIIFPGSIHSAKHAMGSAGFEPATKRL